MNEEMDLGVFFRSVLEQDKAPIVICDLEHTVIYMNPSAMSRYANRGGERLLGRSLMDCHNPQSRKIIEEIIEWFKNSENNNIVYESRNEAEKKDVYIVALRNENRKLIGYYEKHEFRADETSSFYCMP